MFSGICLIYKHLYRNLRILVYNFLYLVHPLGIKPSQDPNLGQRVYKTPPAIKPRVRESIEREITNSISLHAPRCLSN